MYLNVQQLEHIWETILSQTHAQLDVFHKKKPRACNRKGDSDQNTSRIITAAIVTGRVIDAIIILPGTIIALIL